MTRETLERATAVRGGISPRDRSAIALLTEIAGAAAGENDLARILRGALDRLSAHVALTGGSIALVEGDLLVVRAAVGPFAADALGDQLPRGRGRAWQVLDARESFLTGDLAAAGLRVADGRRPIHSWLAVPLLWRDSVVGLLEVDSTERDAFTEEDRALVEGVATVLSGTVEMARRYQAEVDARAAASAAAQRTARLQEITAALSEALTVGQVADVLLVQGRSALDAAAGSVALLVPGDPRRLHIAAAAGYPEDVVERWSSFPVDAATPLGLAVLERRPIHVESPADLAEHFPHTAPDAVASGHGALVAYPLSSGGRPVGAIGLSFREPRTFDAADRAFLVALAQQCTQALERARLYEAERAARAAAETAVVRERSARGEAEAAGRRLRFLSEAAAVLAETLDYEETLRRLTTLAVPALADWCVVDLLDEAGRLHAVGIAHEDPEKVELARRYRERYPPNPSRREGAMHVAQTGETVFYPQIGDEQLRRVAHDEEHFALLRELRLSAGIIVPLRIGERVLGVLSLVRTDGGRYDDADVEVAEEIGRRAAIAVDTAHLYRELARFRTTLDALLDAVFIFDPATLRFSYVNRGAVSSLGYTRQDLLTMTALDLKVEFDEARLRSLIEPLRAGRAPSVTFTTTHRRSDGSLVPVEVLLQYVAPENEPGRMVMIARDITDRVEAQARLQRLAQSERSLSAELRAIIRAMGDGVLVFAADGRLLFANPAAEAMFAGSVVERFDDLRDRMGDPDAVPAPGVREVVGPVELRTRDEDERWFEVTAYPVLTPPEAVTGSDPDDRVETILFMRDVTDARLARLARDAFIGVLSHELRTPVTTIYGNSKLLARVERSRSETLRREVFGDIETEAERLYRLVEDLLVLARFGDEAARELGREPLLLQRIVPAIVRSEEGRWPVTRFDVEIEPGLAPAQGDQTYVEQVVRNLVNNAAKYGGPDTLVRIIVGSEDDDVSVSVLDEGPGFPPEEASRLFDLFYRSPHTAGRASGAGIGLFVCRRLIEAMDGRIWARTRPEGGSEFGFALKVFTEEVA